MKKEYITPEIKMVKMSLANSFLQSSGNNLNVPNDSPGIGFSAFENSNGDSDYWDF